MPIAVVMEEPERFELRTCPGGYVTVRRMSYGEKLERRKYNSKMEMEMNRSSKTAKSVVDIFKEEMELFDFAHCVVDHNLTKPVGDGQEAPLDFKKPADVKMLAARVAEEIGTIIDKLNNFEEDDDVKN